MITGTVINLHALVPVTFELPDQSKIDIEFVIDTGFTGHLTLPKSAVEALALPFLYLIPADLADDSTIEVEVHAAAVIWNGTARNVRVLATGKRPMLGTGLLDGFELNVLFHDQGPVRITDVQLQS